MKLRTLGNCTEDLVSPITIIIASGVPEGTQYSINGAFNYRAVAGVNSLDLVGPNVATEEEISDMEAA